MPFVDRPGYRLHVRSWGDPDAPPLLLVMGLGMCSLAWHRLPERLADRFRVIAFDNRGIGQSTAPRGGFRMRDLADDALAVLDAEGVQQANVFGISMGGMIAQELVLHHPQRVGSLVLGATFASHLRSHKPHPRIARDLLLAGVLLDRTEVMARLLVSDDCFARQRARFTEYVEQLSVPSLSIARRQVVAIALHDTRARLGQIGAPTLVVSGDRDRLVPVENSRLLAQWIPGARYVELPGVGHGFPFEREEETVRLLRDHCLAPRSVAPVPAPARARARRATPPLPSPAT
jgi:3-oxoadipate enol-lactonase